MTGLSAVTWLLLSTLLIGIHNTYAVINFFMYVEELNKIKNHKVLLHNMRIMKFFR